MGRLSFYFSYFMELTRQQISGVSIVFFIETCIISVITLILIMCAYERLTGNSINARKKRAFMLMAVYACFIFQIAFFRRFGTEKSAIHTRIYFGFHKWDGTLDEKQLVYSFLNVVFFIPWGFLVASAIDNKMRRLVMTFFYSLLTSLFIEILQYLTRTGASEITDLITNVCGGMIGCILYIVIAYMFHNAGKMKEGNI